MNTILITGGAGNVGGSLARHLVQDNSNFVVIVDNLLTGSESKLPSSNYKNWKFIKANVNTYKDIAPIFARYNFDYVFHYAAVVGVKRTLENPLWVFQDIDGFRNILGLSKNIGIKKLFFSSSSEVYGEPVEFPQNENTTPLNSRLPYAIVKNLGESMIQAYYKEYGLNYNIFRFFNTYSPLQSTDFVMARFIQAALSDQPITIYGDGSQTRTFCYVQDNVEVVSNIMQYDLCANEVINIGHEQEVSILNLAEKIIKIAKSKSTIQHLPSLKEGDMTRRCPDTTKMKQILKRPLTPIEEGIEIMISHYKHYGK